jgi:hypothetical protein
VRGVAHKPSHGARAARAGRPGHGPAADKYRPGHRRRVELKRTGRDIDAFVAALPPGQQELVAALRRTVKAAAPHLVETVRWDIPVFTGRAPVAALLCYDEEVHLSFFEGARLKVDAAMLERTGIKEALYLLQGVGDRVRFLRMRAAADFEPETVAELARQAAALDRG